MNPTLPFLHPASGTMCVTRTATAVYMPGEQIGSATVYPTHPVTFEVEPIPREQAFAHLALHWPDGLMVHCRKRGPRGGYLQLSIINGAHKLPRVGTFHKLVEPLQ